VKRDTTHVPVGDKRERKIIESPRPIAVLPRRRIRSEERRSSSSGHRTGTSSSSGTDTEPKWVINVTTPSKTQAEFEEQERREAEEADLIRRQLSLERQRNAFQVGVKVRVRHRRKNTLADSEIWDKWTPDIRKYSRQTGIVVSRNNYAKENVVQIKLQNSHRTISVDTENLDQLTEKPVEVPWARWLKDTLAYARTIGTDTRGLDGRSPEAAYKQLQERNMVLEDRSSRESSTSPLALRLKDPPKGYINPTNPSFFRIQNCDYESPRCVNLERRAPSLYLRPVSEFKNTFRMSESMRSLWSNNGSKRCDPSSGPSDSDSQGSPRKSPQRRSMPADRLMSPIESERGTPRSANPMSHRSPTIDCQSSPKTDSESDESGDEI